MSKIEDLKQTYMKDVDLAASKQKFGYFSMPPSAFAGSTTFQQKKIQKNENGKLKTQQRNIFSGLCASGVLKKSYFSYPEYKNGDKYLDPGKVDRQRQMKENQKFKDKQMFRPASLNKTLNSASYEYVPQKETRKDSKLFRTEDGKVRTQNPNVLCSPASKIDYKNQSQLKYMTDSYQNPKMLRRKQLLEDIAKRGQNAFKPSSPVKQLFSSNKEQFKTVDVPPKKQKLIDLNIHQHDSNFRPGGNHFNDGVFSYPKYVPEGNQNDKTAKVIRKDKSPDEKKEPFKLIKQEKNSRPCPSVSLSKMNLMRSMRG